MEEQKPVRMSYVVDFAHRIRQLQQINPETLLISPDTEDGIIQVLEAFIDDLQFLELKSSDLLAHELLAPLRNKLISKYKNGQTSINAQLTEFRRKFDKVADQLEQDLSHSVLYRAKGKSQFPRYDPPEHIKPLLPSETEKLIDEAQECWAVGFELGAVVLAMMATEVLTRFYLQKLCNSSGEKTWGQTVGEFPESESEFKTFMFDLVERRNGIVHSKEEITTAQAMAILGTCREASETIVVALLNKNLLANYLNFAQSNGNMLMSKQG